MVQTFISFEHVQIFPKLKPTKVFARGFEITHFFLTQQLVLCYSIPDVPINTYMVAMYHCLEACMMSRKVQISTMCVPEVWLEGRGNF